MRLLLPLPANDFDPTEAAVPWRVLTQAGIEVIVATPDGKPALADPRMLSGKGLGILAPFLRADRNGQEAYQEFSQKAFRSPLTFQQALEQKWQAILLPGGHAPGMKPYLESADLQSLVAEHFRAGKPLAAICHGVVLAARSGILKGRQVTALPRWMELQAWWLTRAWLGSYYRTYPETVQEEVTRALARPEDFQRGPLSIRRDSPGDLRPGFVVEDGNLLTARWPGDAHSLAQRLIEKLKRVHASRSAHP